MVTFPIYQVSSIYKWNNPSGNEIWWLQDMDGDGNSEIAQKSDLKDNASTIYFRSSDGREFQTNFDRDWLPQSALHFTDVDKDGKMEAFGFQFESDSLFISGVEYPGETILNERFLTTGFSDIVSSTTNVVQTNKSNRLLISVMGGYGAQPRNLFLLHLKSDVLIKSADTIQAYLQYLATIDIEDDGSEEMVAWGRSPDNNHGGEFFSDQNAYLMFFDEELNLKKWFKARGLLSSMQYWVFRGNSYFLSNNMEPEVRSYMLKLNGDDLDTILISQPGEVFGFVKSNEERTILQQTSKITEEYALVYYDGHEFKVIKQEARILANNGYPQNTETNVFVKNDPRKISICSESGRDCAFLSAFDGPISISDGVWNGEQVVLVSSAFGHALLAYDESVLVYLNYLLPLVAAASVYFVLGLVKSRRPRRSNVLRINTRSGFEIIPMDKILHCKADGRYTEIETVDNGQVVSSQNLGNIEPLIHDDNFVRVSRSLIINKSYLRKVDRKKLKAYFKVPTGTKELVLNTKEVKELKEVF